MNLSLFSPRIPDLVPQYTFYNLPMAQKAWTPPVLQSHDFLKWTYRITCIGLLALAFLVDVSVGNLYRLTIGNRKIYSQNVENQEKFLQATKEVARNRRIALGALAIGATALAAFYLVKRASLPHFLDWTHSSGNASTILNQTNPSPDTVPGSNPFFWIAGLAAIGTIILGSLVCANGSSAKVRRTCGRHSQNSTDTSSGTPLHRIYGCTVYAGYMIRNLLQKSYKETTADIAEADIEGCLRVGDGIYDNVFKNLCSAMGPEWRLNQLQTFKLEALQTHFTAPRVDISTIDCPIEFLHQEPIPDNKLDPPITQEEQTTANGAIVSDWELTKKDTLLLTIQKLKTSAQAIRPSCLSWPETYPRSGQFTDYLLNPRGAQGYVSPAATTQEIFGSLLNQLIGLEPSPGVAGTSASALAAPPATIPAIDTSTTALALDTTPIGTKIGGLLTADGASYSFSVRKEPDNKYSVQFFDSHGELQGENTRGPAYIAEFSSLEDFIQFLCQKYPTIPPQGGPPTPDHGFTLFPVQLRPPPLAT